MPIFGLTDGTPTLKEVGRIRKGGPKTDKFKPGPNLEHFRVTWREDEKDAREKFESIYGAQPTLINVRLAFDSVDDNWEAWYKCFLKGGMLGQADGRKWHYLRDYRTHEVLIRNGEATKLGQERGIKVEFDEDEPVYFYFSNNKKKDMPVFARPEGRLNVVIPELGRYVYLVALTHSKNDIRNLDGQIKDIARRANLMGLLLSQIPLVLTRRKDQITKPIGDGRGMVDEWLVHMEIHPDFADLSMRYIDHKTVQVLSLPDARPPQQEVGLLPEPVESNGYSEEDPSEDAGEDVGEIKPGKTFDAKEQQEAELEEKISEPVSNGKPKDANDWKTYYDFAKPVIAYDEAVAIAKETKDAQVAYDKLQAMIERQGKKK